MIKTPIGKLTKSEFYTTYGISLLADKVEGADQEFLAVLLQEIAERYRDITLYALRDELRHFVRGAAEEDTGGDYEEENLATLSKRGISTDFNSKVRESLDIDTIIYLFAHGVWECEYGGKAWEKIAKTCKELMGTLPATRYNLKKVAADIDRLNDLEHNNDLYLSEYCTFKLYLHLEYKGESTPRQIFADSSSDIQKLAKEYRGVLK